jgi:alkylation response protein AidB-like acyl-CoA dehydrogenase
MNFDLSEEHELLRSTVRDFAESRIVPVAAELDREARFPYELVAELAELGLMGIPIPEEHGGAGADTVAYALAIEELTRVDSSVAITVAAHTSLGTMPIYLYGTEEQKQEWLPRLTSGEGLAAFGLTEPNAGSDAGATSTRAELRDGQWVVNGAKMFITNAVYGDILIVAARTDPAAKGSRGISLFIVERTTPGICVTKLDKHGWLCSDTAEIAFQDVRIPAGNLLGEENRGFYGIMETFENERICIGGICAGESAKAIELTTNYVKSRQAFGGPLWNQQAVRLKLASLATKAAAARALAYHAAELVEAGKPCPREVSMVKALSPEVLHEVVHGCLQLHGGTGFMRGTPIERMVRDARVLTIGGGATEVMLEEVAKRM